MSAGWHCIDCGAIEGTCDCPGPSGYGSSCEWRGDLKQRVDLVLEGFEPRRLVSANRRIHHMVRAEVCAYWRRLGHDLIVGEYGHADVGQTWHHSVRMVMTFRFPDLRRRDCHNLYGYVIKPLVDGMVDGRLIPDDDDRHLIGPDVRRDPERGPHRIRIDVEDVA